jgi:hypothetical protein
MSRGHDGGVHRVPDGDAACLDTVGQELAELAIQIQCCNPQQGREELCPDCHLQQGKVRSRVRCHALHVLPLVLQAEGESGMSSLWIVTVQEGQRFHCCNPRGHHAAKPVRFVCVAPNEATQVSLPARVLDVQVIRLECLSSNHLVFHLTDVSRLTRVREIAIPGPIAQQVTKTRRIVHSFASCSSVIRVSGG